MFNEQCKYLLYGGAAGGGKSHFLRWCAVALGSYYYEKYNLVGAPIGLFSEDYPTLRDRQVVKIEKEFPAWLGRIKETNAYGLAFVARPEYGGWVIMLRNLDDPSKYASVEFVAILVEELTKNPEQTFGDLRSRLRYPGIPDPKFVGATNPGQVGHGWVKRKWVKPDPADPDPEKERFFFVPARYSDNHFIDASYEKQLDAIPDPQLRRALKDGDWDIFEGQFFTEWRDERHVIDKLPVPLESCRIVLGFDWGYFAPGCCSWWAIAPENRYGVTHLYKFREMYRTQTNPEEWADNISIFTEEEGADFIVLPHDCFSSDKGERTIADIFAKKIRTPGDEGSYHNIRVVRGNTLARGARINRAATMHMHLSDSADGRPYAQILRKCQNTIRTMPDLVCDPNNAEDLDTRGEDHAYDSDSLALMTIKSTYNINSGPVKAVNPYKEQKPLLIPVAGGYQGPDFLKTMKELERQRRRRG